ncbi:ATP dependent RNA helicase [Halochromatium sp.]
MQGISTDTTDTALALDSLPLHLPPEMLKARLADLIRTSVNHGAAAVATTVVRHFQALAMHPQLGADSDERAAYCRGAHHWRGLAAIGEPCMGQGAEAVPAGAR